MGRLSRPKAYSEIYPSGMCRFFQRSDPKSKESGCLLRPGQGVKATKGSDRRTDGRRARVTYCLLIASVGFDVLFGFDVVQTLGLKRL